MKIQIFEKEEFGKVRVAEVDGTPMFCLSDVAKALEYANPAKAVIDHCKGVSILGTPTTNQHGAVVMQNIKYGKESEVYRLVMKSKAKRAEAFQDWVCEEVLPSIRKTGSYNLPSTYLDALKQLVIAEEEKQRLALENSEMKPKAEYYDGLVERGHLTNFRDTAKELGMKQNAFVDMLIAKGYVYRDRGGKLKPYAKYTPRFFEMKDFKSEGGTHTGTQTLITPDGKAEFRRIMKNSNGENSI